MRNETREKFAKFPLFQPSNNTQIDANNQSITDNDFDADVSSNDQINGTPISPQRNKKLLKSSRTHRMEEAIHWRRAKATDFSYATNEIYLSNFSDKNPFHASIRINNEWC